VETGIRNDRFSLAGKQGLKSGKETEGGRNRQAGHDAAEIKVRHGRLKPCKEESSMKADVDGRDFNGGQEGTGLCRRPGASDRPKGPILTGGPTDRQRTGHPSLSDATSPSEGKEGQNSKASPKRCPWSARGRNGTVDP